MNMKGIVKGTFASLTALMFGFAAGTVLCSAFRTPGFAPSDAHTFILSTVGAAIIAFISTQLGIMSESPANRLSYRASAAMGVGPMWSSVLLLTNSIVILVSGILFVLLWLNPNWIAVQEGAPLLAAAPDYISTQAKAFIGITMGALAALAPSTS